MGDDDPEEKPMLAAARMTARETAADGPPEWLEKLFVEHHERVFRAAYRITGNAMDAEDVLQTVFLRLLRRDDPAPLPGSPGSYLHQAAINGALDLMRARIAARSTPLEAAGQTLAADATFAPDRAQANREIKTIVREALAGLSSKSAEIFALRYFEGYGNREIARMLDTSESVVAVVLHRARQRIQEAIIPIMGGRS